MPNKSQVNPYVWELYRISLDGELALQYFEQFGSKLIEPHNWAYFGVSDFVVSHAQEQSLAA